MTNSNNLPIVEACQKPDQKWLQSCGLSSQDAEAIAKRPKNDSSALR